VAGYVGSIKGPVLNLCTLRSGGPPKPCHLFTVLIRCVQTHLFPVVRCRWEPPHNRAGDGRTEGDRSDSDTSASYSARTPPFSTTAYRACIPAIRWNDTWQ
jgi:hypothetical protein